MTTEGLPEATYFTDLSRITLNASPLSTARYAMPVEEDSRIKLVLPARPQSNQAISTAA